MAAAIPMFSSRNKFRNKRLQLWHRDGPYCQICGRTFERFTDREVTLDHIQPQFLGGGHDLSNLRLACGRCNLNYAKQFQHLINLKAKLVHLRRSRPGADPNQKYVMVISPTSNAATLVPKGIKRVARELLQRRTWTRPCPHAVVYPFRSPAVPVAQVAPSFATSPNVVHHAGNKTGIGIPPWVPASYSGAAHLGSGSAGMGQPILVAPPPCVMDLEPMDLSD